MSASVFGAVYFRRERLSFDARVKKILYLHGFASSPAGRKISALRDLLEPLGFEVVAPDLNIPSFRRLDFDAIVRLALWEAKRHSPAVVVGSSLGALATLEVSRRGATAPLLLIAPAVGFGKRWVEKLPPGDPLSFFHHGEGRELSIHRRFFEQLAAFDTDLRPPSAPVTVVMGSRDESVPVELVREVWTGWNESGSLASGSRLIEIEGGDHGLVDHIRPISQEIVRLASDAIPA
jgi:hypothetical protein